MKENLSNSANSCHLIAKEAQPLLPIHTLIVKSFELLREKNFLLEKTTLPVVFLSS